MAEVGLHGLGELGFQGVTHELEFMPMTMKWKAQRRCWFTLTS